jgi:hypothetical protein
MYILEKPIIIWTLRRTGGTSLADFLFTSSKFKSIQDEPFNIERVWGDLTYDLKDHLRTPVEEWNLGLFRERIAVYCNKKHNIKHAIDNTPFLVTKYLLEVSQEVGYKHIVLLRKNQFQRILSLIIAQQTTWKLGRTPDIVFPKIINGELEMQEISFENISQFFDSSINMIGRLYEELHQNDVEYYSVYFEELYSDKLSKHERLTNATKILDYLNIEQYDPSLLDRNIFKSSENTQSVYDYISNYDQLKALAKPIPSPKMRY